MSNFIGVRHVGLAAKNPAALAAFYRDVLLPRQVRVYPLPVDCLLTAESLS
jgi:catechol 2,3-dioxygenase-like lactoylglutathione lyase family enzyme